MPTMTLATVRAWWTAMVPAPLATAMSAGRIIREVTDEGAETLFAYDEQDRVVSVAMSAIRDGPTRSPCRPSGSSCPHGG